MMKKTNKLEHYPQLNRRKSYSKKQNYENYNYRYYKSEIAEDSQNRCVYCDAHIDEIGGIEMMQLDHFRPQKHFPELINSPDNLVLACSRCNLLKRDDWIIDISGIVLKSEVTYCDGNGYIDPFAVDRKFYFTIEPNGMLVPTNDPAPYLIEKLALNRRFLVKNRAKRNLIGQAITLFKRQIELLELKLSKTLEQDAVELYQKQINEKEIFLRILQDFI